MTKGDIVLLPFPFTDLTGSKFRPAIILISGKDFLTVAFISTRLHWKEETDLILMPDNENGLKKESLVRTAKIATISKSLVIGELGKIDEKDMLGLNKDLKVLLDLD